MLNYDEYKAKKNGETYEEENCEDGSNSTDTVSLSGDEEKETNTKKVPKKKVMPPKQESEPEREQGDQEKQLEEKLPQPEPQPKSEPKPQPKTQPTPKEKSAETDHGNSGQGGERQKGDMTYYDVSLQARSNLSRG